MSDFVPTPHPVLKLPSRAHALAWGPEKTLQMLKQREEIIAREKNDPYHYGYEPGIWKRVEEMLTEGFKEIWLLGGNRGSKSDYAAKKVMKILMNKPGARAWCFQSSEYNSVEMQQPILWRYMPADYRNLKKGQVTNISYTQKNGFSENTFVLPNGSQCWFRNYMQDPTTIEGGELDVIWFDELVPLNFLETGRFRLATRAGLLIVTFTPIEGYTATVKSILQGAQTIEEADAELLPGRKVPRVQQPVRSNARIVYFHTADNPYGGYENLKKTLEGAKTDEILCRAYGVPTKAINSRFPKFNDKVHVIREDLVPKEGTRFLFVDPCGGRNWFMAWVLVDQRNWFYIYREWPSPGTYIEGVGDPGLWAEPDGKLFDGKRGDSQKPFGFGLKRYKEEIERRENGEEIYERFMDSRYGNAKTVGKENPTTLIEECEEVGLFFMPTPGDNIDEGIEFINDALDYDTQKPVSAMNSPKLYVTENCKNLIFALHEWTGQDGRHGACKDPIDLVRYMVTSELQYIGKETLRVRPGGSY